MTNYERIKAMSIDEMRELMFDIMSDCDNTTGGEYCSGDCMSCIHKWLSAEVLRSTTIDNAPEKLRRDFLEVQ